MPLFYEHNTNFAKIAIWHIAEEKKFFLERVPLQREITHPHKQQQHLAGRYLLQHIYPDFPYHLIEIADTRKPYLPNEEYHFSISHCGDYAAVIVSKDHRVGVDIEVVSDKVERIKHKFLKAGELKLVAGCRLPVAGNSINHSAIQPINNLTLLWCCKEAVFKWYGKGDVDFKKDINVNPVEIRKEEGVIKCRFSKEEPVDLNIEYKMFNELCLAWVATKN